MLVKCLDVSTIATTFTNTVIKEPVAEAVSPGRQERFGAKESEFEPWLHHLLGKAA